MKTIIIEDEEFAARRLENMIGECDSTIEIVAKLQSVRESVAWLKNNAQPDLIFLDIHLDDDISFSIFEQINVQSPIIFTTAFDTYAIKAFKLKSIDYLLKPINQTELNQAITKYKNWSSEKTILLNPAELRQLLIPQTPQYRERFSVTVGEKLKTVAIADIAYFFSNSGITFLVTHTQKQYSLDVSLDHLKEQLKANEFFRVNRQYLISLKAITNVHIFPKSRLKIDLNPPATDDVFVSVEKVPEFKLWMDGVF